MIDLGMYQSERYLAIRTVEEVNFKIYPNPTTGIAYMDIENNSEVKVYTATGYLIRIAYGTEIDLSGLDRKSTRLNSSHT